MKKTKIIISALAFALAFGSTITPNLAFAQEQGTDVEADREDSVIYKTVYKYDDTKKVGYRDVTTKGVLGKNTSKPIDEVITVGTKPIETEESEVLEHKTIELKDANLDLGEKKVEVEGKDGKLIKKTIKTYNKETNSIETEIIEKTETPINTIIKVGTKEDVESIFYDIKFERDDTKDASYMETTREGVVGKRDKKTGKVLLEPIDEIITIGIQDSIKETEEVVKYETEEIEDPTLEKGVRFVRREGKNGSVKKVVTKKVNPNYNHFYHRSEEIETRPINEIIIIGTKEVEEGVETIPYKSNYQYKNNIEEKDGKRIVHENGEEIVQKGENGRKENGEVVKEPVDEIIVNYIESRGDSFSGPNFTKSIKRNDPYLKKGQEIEPKNVEPSGHYSAGDFQNVSKDTNYQIQYMNYKEESYGEPIVVRVGTQVDIEELPYETIYEYDNTKEVGYREITTEGVIGKKDLDAGKIIKEPINEIITIGVKEKIDTKKTPIEYKTETIEDSNLKKGEEKVIQEGKDGVVVTTIKITYNKNNNSIEKEVIEETKDSINKIVLVGTKSEKDNVDDENSIILYKTIYKYNEDKKVGYRKLLQEGFNGKKEKGIITKEPVDEIVEVGVKPNITVDKENIKYEIETIKDENLKVGERVVDRKGVNGIIKTTTTKTFNKENGKIEIESKNETKEPINEIVRVGTKEETTKTEKIEISFETIRRANKNLYKGFERIASRGINGLAKVTIIDDKQVNKEIVRDKVDEIIEYGTKEIPENKKVEEREINFKVVYKEDKSLKVGEEKVSQEGKKGIQVITYKYIVDKDGNLKEIVDNKEVKEKPVDKIILKGIENDLTNTKTKKDINASKNDTKTSNSNVRTGVSSIVGVAGILSAASVAYLSSKKKDK